jgi:hypothetical protein
MRKSRFGNVVYESENEQTARRQLLGLLRQCPVPDDEIISNLGLFLNSKLLSRILFLHHIYTQIVDIPGVVIEFGTRWGQNASLFAAMRGIYDTFNRHRKIIVFDTFEGFPVVHPKDGKSGLMKKGNLSVTENYKDYLDKVLEFQENDNPLAHIRRFETIAGDATLKLKKYLKDFPETIVALAYFDFDLYEPTKKGLELIKPHLIKGSVLGFDELNDHDSPGETVALNEVFGLNNVKLKRFRPASRVSYFTVE